MARPPKTENQAFDTLIKFRVTAEQHQALQAKAAEAGLNVSDFARGVLLKAKPRQRQVLPHEIEAVKALGELGHIRADINQLLKDRFSHRFVRPEDVKKSLDAIVQMADVLHDILKAHGH